jgi:integrase
MKKTAVIWTKPNRQNLYHIKIRTYDKGITSYEPLNRFIPKKDWCESTRLVKTSNAAHVEINTEILKALYPFKTSISQMSPGPNQINPANSTIEDILNQMMDELFAHGQIGTYKKHKTALTHLRKSRINSIKLNEFSNADKVRFQNYLTNVASVKPQGQETYIKVLKKVLKYAVDNDLRDKPSPYDKDKIRKAPSKPRRFLMSGEIKVLYLNFLYAVINPGADTSSLAKYLFAFFSSGMRFTDVTKLKWGNIQNGYLQYTMSKTNKNLQSPLRIQHLIILINYLPKEMIRDKNTGNYLSTYFNLKQKLNECINTILIEYKKSVNEDKPLQESVVNSRYEVLTDLIAELIHQASIEHNDDYIFHNFQFDRMTILDVYNKISGMNAITNSHLKEFAIKNNLKHFSFHSNRHSFSNYALSLGWNSFDIMKKLGHSSLNETQKYLDAFVDVTASKNANYVESVLTDY